MAYAEKTSVPFEKSIGEVMTLIRRAGAEQVGQMEGPNGFVVQFALKDRMIKFAVPFETMDQMPYRDGRGSPLSDSARKARAEQSRRQRGRALLLTIKAKLESIESGVETFEQAFLAHVVMPDGATIYERISRGIAIEYKSGKPDSDTLLLQ